MYSAAVLARVRDPKFVGWFNRDAPDVGTGESGSLDAGTFTRIQVRVNGQEQRIEEAVFKVFGCSAAIASASLVTERLHGAALDDARAMDGMVIVAELQLPVDRANVAAMAVAAAHAAIADWEKKHAGAVSPG
jgi:nitrogen fixation NifU-like protein